MKNEIYIKSLFSGWIKSDKKHALEWAKLKLKGITTGRSDESRLTMINDRIRGIQFTLTHLK